MERRERCVNLKFSCCLVLVDMVRTDRTATRSLHIDIFLAICDDIAQHCTPTREQNTKVWFWECHTSRSSTLVRPRTPRWLLPSGWPAAPSALGVGAAEPAPVAVPYFSCCFTSLLCSPAASTTAGAISVPVAEAQHQSLWPEHNSSGRTMRTTAHLNTTGLITQQQDRRRSLSSDSE